MVKPVIKDVREKLVSGTKRLYEWFKSQFKPSEKNEDQVTNPVVADKLKDLTDRIDQSDSPVKLSAVPEEIRSDFHIQIRNMAIAGFNDGVSGTKTDSHLKIAAEKADEFHREFYAHSKGKLETLSNEIHSKQKVVNSKWQQATLHHSYQNYLQHHYKFNERGNTIGEFLLYFLLFGVIFLADIPLAVETVKRLYPTYMTNKQFSLSSIWQNLEALLTAVGLAASSIYIKICYDEFVGKKYGHAVISEKKFVELFNESGSKMEELTEAEKAKIDKHEKTVKVIKGTIFFFTLVVIVVMGIFRKYAWMQSQHMIGSINSWVLTLAFISLTLMFSIVSGICLSVALNAWTNYKRLRRCKNENTDLEKEFLKESSELAGLQGEHERFVATLEQWGDREAWVTKVREFLAAYYAMGYNEGRSDPGYFMKHLDFFGRVLIWRESFTARKINQHANRLNTNL